ncbi:deoxyhypusine synthase-like [Asparagus officinalis]|uniref:deoxyhypusine synthase-like n=1 Tax=Asparagus officinalis TaxID=4686 RepID=UPI00098DFC27|nr:deoxyhypusine synthase-like isoform X1 [Asparagus officinalis]XP_020243733.1 deoxyhypusine synthase-like [Asparagus officinalis]XP_020251225.1 deoxyhypusine synthase-like [Asparagus officinalis]
MEDGNKTLDAVRSVLFKESETLEGKNFPRINGYDFNKGVDLAGLIFSMASTGFQASNLGDAIQVVNQMLDWRLSHEEPAEDCSEEERDPSYRESIKCKIFLGFTSILISSGVREIIRFLVEHRMVSGLTLWVFMF